MARTIIGVFDDRDDCEEAITDLKAIGYNPKDISLIMKDKNQGEELKESTGAGDIASGAAAGAGTGAVVGGVAGFLAGTMLPALGGFLIGGPIGAAIGLTGAAATTVSGVATGVVAGGIIGALTKAFGLTDDEAKDYEDKINHGGILMAVPVQAGDEEEVREVMEEDHGHDIREAATQEKSADYSDDYTQAPAYHSEVSRTSKGADKGRGWHGDPEEHAEARRGEEPRSGEADDDED
jgi:hypothetical protein